MASPRARPRAPLALPGLLLIAAAMLALLLALAGEYGFHRDELYFIVAGRHPDWGYVDQPPLTPLLSAVAVELLGLAPVSIRILPALAAALVAVLAGMSARELGGTRRAQLLAAALVPGSVVLGLGHLDSTTTFDMLAWVLIGWLFIRLLGGADPREWLWLGLAAGIGLQNKHLVVLLGIGLAIGVVVARRWDVVRSGWAWAGIGLALVIWLPNLAWQAANGFPQLVMGGRIAASSSMGDVLMVIPFQLLMAGLLLFPVFLVGLWYLLRADTARPWRAVGWAYVAVLALTLLLRGKVYYPAGLLPIILAAGALPLDSWLSGGRTRLRATAFGIGVAGSLAIGAVLTLPVLPPSVLAATPIPDIYPESAEQIGWPELVSTVRGVVDELPADQRERAVVLTVNYGEAGALELLGGEEMPPVYSGHNAYGDWGPPPDHRDVVVLVGWWRPETFREWIGDCERRATITNPAGVPNQELGADVWVCPEPRVSWSEVWDELRFLN